MIQQIWHPLYNYITYLNWHQLLKFWIRMNTLYQAAQCSHFFIYYISYIYLIIRSYYFITLKFTCFNIYSIPSFGTSWGIILLSIKTLPKLPIWVILHGYQFHIHTYTKQYHYISLSISSLLFVQLIIFNFRFNLLIILSHYVSRN